MSVPLDRLYHYIESVAEKIRGSRVIIYHFYPHGSKKLEDLTPLRVYNNTDIVYPEIYCNDQEPLDYQFYDDYPPFGQMQEFLVTTDVKLPNIKKRSIFNIHDWALLLHSEQRSTHVDQYKNNYCIPVYYWSHAIIARDWFRFAEHAEQKKNIRKRFLIYNRAWSGTREYRLKFANYLIELDVVFCSQMSCSPVDPGIDKHYNLHTFKNPAWRPNHVIEDYFPISTAESHYSAQFDIEDYNATEIEVVLETLFDDDRLHLTEKILRPIAVGQPFMIAGPAGSLEYLRSYGFKTFNEIWDEGYDCKSNAEDRLYELTHTMKHISQWSEEEKTSKLARAQDIADYNRKHFFSKEFVDQVEDELKNNLDAGFKELEKLNTSTEYFRRRKVLANNPISRHFVFNPYDEVGNRQQTAKAVALARSHYLRSLSPDS